MRGWPEVIEVKESLLAGLTYAYPGEAHHQRLGQYLVGIDASTGYVYGSPFGVGAWLFFRRLDTMLWATIARANYYWLTILGPQHLESIHRQRIHPALAGLLASQLGKGEVRPSICLPSIVGIVHYFFFGFGFGLVLRLAFRAAAAARLPAAV